MLKTKTFKECIIYLTKKIPLSKIDNTPNGVLTWYVGCGDKEAYRISNTKFINDITPNEARKMSFILSVVLDEKAKEIENPHFITGTNVMECVWPISKMGEWNVMLNRIVSMVTEKRNKKNKK